MKLKSARPRHRNFDQQRARAFKKERMFQTCPVLNKKTTFILVCKPNQNYEVCLASRGLIFTIFFSLETFEFLEILDTVETRLSPTA